MAYKEQIVPCWLRVTSIFPHTTQSEWAGLEHVFSQFQLPEEFLKTDFIICDNTGVVLKLHTTLCSFNNYLNAIKSMFSLIISER